MSVHRERALLLFQQGRLEHCLKELSQHLATEPNDGFAHALLALCRARSEQFDEATRDAQQAIHLDPELPFTHYALAQVLLLRNRPAEARTAIEEAIRLDPHNDLFFGVLASIELARRNWPAALEAAEAGLAIDPEDDTCTNLRAFALVHLGRRDEASQAIEDAISRDPDNADTHANRGWSLLHEGKPTKAMDHFREALRLDPNSEWARTGIVEAMKARNPLYRPILAYFLWISRLRGRAKVGLILGLFVGQRLLSGLARQQPELAPYVAPILIAYLIFVVTSWLAHPLFNLTLRLSRFGRMALSREEVTESNWIGGFLFGGIGMAVAGYFLDSSVALLAGVCSGLLVFPLASMFRSDTGWPRRIMQVYSAAMALVAGLAIALMAGNLQAGENLLGLFFLGAILSTWVGNITRSATVRR